MRIAFDVSPLSHPRTGIGNYVRGSLAGLAEAAAGEHELVAFAPTRLRGRRLIREALDGLPVELRTVVLPWSHAFRMGWSRLGRPSVERFLGRVDVLHFSDWLVPPQRSGIRSTMVHDLVPLLHPEWVTPRTRSMHGYKYARTAECDLVFVNSAYTGRDVEEHLAVPRERIRVAAPGVSAEYTAEGERARLGRPYVLSLATLEPRKNLATLVEAWRPLRGELALAVAGAAGWGDQPLLDDRGILKLGFVAEREVPQLMRGARRLRLSVPVRGLRHADRRGDGLRRARRRLRRIRRWTRPAAAQPCASTRTTPRRWPPGSGRRSSGATSSSPRASRTRRSSRGAAAARSTCRRSRRRA